MIFLVGALAAQLAAIGTVTNSVLGIPYGTGLLIGAAVTISYATVGGIRAVVTTDVLQFVILVVGIGAASAILLAQHGGFEAMLAAADSGQAGVTSQFFPSLGGAMVIQERRGLPTISPDGRLIVSEPRGLRGLVVLSSCGVGGIDRSPGAGRLAGDIVSGGTPWIEPSVLSADRFGDEYATDRSLRARYEEVYSHHYHQVY